MFRKCLILEGINHAEIKSAASFPIQKFVCELAFWEIALLLEKIYFLTKLKISHDNISLLYLLWSFNKTKK